jgi:hypothetical protein
MLGTQSDRAALKAEADHLRFEESYEVPQKVRETEDVQKP